MPSGNCPVTKSASQRAGLVLYVRRTPHSPYGFIVRSALFVYADSNVLRSCFTLKRHHTHCTALFSEANSMFRLIHHNISCERIKIKFLHVSKYGEYLIIIRAKIRSN